MEVVKRNRITQRALFMKSLKNNLNAKFADINISYQERKIALQVLEEIMADLEAINRN